MLFIIEFQQNLIEFTFILNNNLFNQLSRISIDNIIEGIDCLPDYSPIAEIQF